MTAIPLWASIVSVAGVAGMLIMFITALPEDRRPDAAAPLVLRVALVAVLAVDGAFVQAPDAVVPWMGPIILIGLLLSLMSLRSARESDLAALTRGQMFRVVGGVFVALMLVGWLPPLFALPAGLGDIAVGLAAPVIARRLNRGDTRGAAVFHALGLLDLLVAITIGTLSAPGPYQAFTDDVSTAAMTGLPLVLVPAVLVPLSMAVHIHALRQLRTRSPRRVHAVEPARA
jgi:hypothetical protein